LPITDNHICSETLFGFVDIGRKRVDSNIAIGFENPYLPIEGGDSFLV